MADPKDPKAPDPKPADPVIAGGPGGEPEPAAPKLVAVKYGGRELQVPEDVATAWTDREREFDQRLSKQGAELGDIRKRWQSVEQQIQPKPDKPAEPDLNTLWFEDPTKAARLIEERLESKLEGRYRRERALEKFWDGFDRDNPDLRDDRWVAEATFNEHFDELADMTPVKAREELADRTRKKILKLTAKVKTTDTRSPVLLEPASGDRPPRPAREEDEGPKSLSEALAARRQQRRVGAKGE